jgi:NADH-quinone oxidoreductase subunit L
MFVATLAIAGIFPFAGFFSKDEILWQAWSSEGGAYRFLWLIGVITAFMTSFYMFRLMFLTFHGKPRMSHEVEHHIHESPGSMTMPLVVLAVCSIFAGWLGIPHSLGGSNRFERFLEPVFAKQAPLFHAEEPGQFAAGKKEEEHTSPTEYTLMALSLGLAVAGWGLAWKVYRGADKGYVEPLAAKVPPVYTATLNKYYVDEGYDYLFTGRRKLGPVRLGAMGLGEGSSWFDSRIIDGTVNGAGWMTRAFSTLSIWWDRWIIDGLLVNGPAIMARMLSYPVKLLQWGLVQWYALIMVFGLLSFMAAEMGLLSWFGWIVGGVVAVMLLYFVVRLIARRAEANRGRKVAAAGATGD